MEDPPAVQLVYGITSKNYTMPVPFNPIYSESGDSPLIFDNHKVRVMFIVVYTVTFALCFFGNLAVVLVVTLHWKMRSITKYFLGNLAIANLCVSIFCIYQNLSTYLVDTWLFGDFLCKMYHFINSLSHTASILILVIISVERYLVLLHPFRYRRVLTIQRLRGIILVVWGLSAMLCAPRLYYIQTISMAVTSDIPGEPPTTEKICVPVKSVFTSRSADMVYFLVLFLLPLVVITILYAKIGVFLAKSDRFSRSITSSEGTSLRPIIPGHQPQYDLMHLKGKKFSEPCVVATKAPRRSKFHFPFRRAFSQGSKLYFEEPEDLSTTSTSGFTYQDLAQVQLKMRSSGHRAGHRKRHKSTGVKGNREPQGGNLGLFGASCCFNLCLVKSFLSPAPEHGVRDKMSGRNHGSDFPSGSWSVAQVSPGNEGEKQNDSEEEKRLCQLTLNLPAPGSIRDPQESHPSSSNGVSQKSNGSCCGRGRRGNPPKYFSHEKLAFPPLLIRQRRRRLRRRNYPRGEASVDSGGSLSLKRNMCRARTRTRQRVVRMLILMVVTFAICNFPYHLRKLCQSFIDSYDFESDVSHLIIAVTHWLMYINCAINPILYAFIGKSFRSSFQDLLKCRWKSNSQRRPSVFFV